MHKRLLMVFLLVAGCAGTESTAAPEGEETSGGETTTEELPPMRATVPIPVPQPGRAREQLSPELKAVWERVELAVAVTPPEPPAGTSEAEIEAWAEGPFREWLERRRAATDVALEAMRTMREAPVEERAMGAGLFGYLYEDAVSSIRGAPVAEAVSADPELLALYSEAVNAALLPYARLAAQAYYGCVLLFREVNDPAWSEWPQYCDERGSEVVEVFDLVPEEPAAPGEPGAPIEDAEGAPSETPDAGASE